jgi:FHA domain-containing protein
MIWVEILSRSHAVMARYRCVGPDVRIGRSYENDVVVDDPYVDPHHVRIVRNEAGNLVAEDLGSVNGLYGDQLAHRVERLVVDGDRLICIGRTYLRIREANHVVAPARLARPQRYRAPLLMMLGVSALATVVLIQWLSETAEPKPTDYLMPLLILCGGVLAWAGCWAMLSSVLSGQACFDRSLLIALNGALLFALGSEVAEIAAFALSWSAIATYSYAGAWALLAVLCFLHLRDVSASRVWLKGGAIAALAVLAIATQTLLQLDGRTDSTDANRQSEARRHMPPTFRLVPLQSEAAFFARAAELKGKLDSDRSQ